MLDYMVIVYYHYSKCFSIRNFFNKDIDFLDYYGMETISRDKIPEKRAIEVIGGIIGLCLYGSMHR
jgi:hypothetical protein